MSIKTITWKSWNALADEYIYGIQEEYKKMEEEIEALNEENPEMGMMFQPILKGEGMNVIYTPLGAYPIDSMFKPSDRWDCRIGVTNFSITHSIKSKVKRIEGIEALKILGRYTFFIGIPASFNFRDVRSDIEKELCVYTEEEVMTGETATTVELVKEQLKNNKYWSILVASTGKVDYIVSDKFDQSYLEGLNKLVELKQKLGGIILRGDDG